MHRQKAAGFTLVELLVVISIIAILAAMTLGTYHAMARHQRQDACINNLKEIGQALIMYHDDYDAYPAAPRPDYLRSLGGVNTAPDPPLWTPRPPAERTIDRLKEALPFTARGVFSYPAFTDFDAGDAGPNDLVNGGAYTGTVTRQYTVTIDGAAPDTFTWTWSEGGAEEPGGTGVPITGKSQALNAGVTVRFQLTTGHAVNDRWVFSAQVPSGLDTWQAWEPDPANPPYYTYTSFAGLPAAQQLAQLKTGNFGLSALYYAYGGQPDTPRRYTRTNAETLFHCPAMERTNTAEREVNLAQADNPFKTFDPLFTGAQGAYNSYDVTYNYDQYNNEIAEFDRAVGMPGLHIVRQLKSNLRAPADTVVCWCYGHRDGRTLGFPTARHTGDLSSPFVPDSTAAPSGRNENMRQRVLVLWLDGSVAIKRPYMMRHATEHAYYWVPPFLYTREGGES